MRDLMMLGAMLIMVPMSLANGFVAYLFWGYTSQVIINSYAYGFMQTTRFNLIFAIVTVASIMLGRVNERGGLKLNWISFLLLMFLIHGILCTIFAYDANPFCSVRLETFSKSLFYILLMPYFVTNRVRIHATLLMIAIGLGTHGVIEGLKMIASGGGHQIAGIPNSSLGDNNLFSVGIVMVLPIMIYLAQYSKFKLIRVGFILAFSLTIMSVLGTQSRGGFLSLAGVGIGLLFTSQSKVKAGLLVLLGLLIIYFVAPDSWFARMSTIQSADADGSFMGRVAAWQVSSAIALANPLFGGGYDSVQTQWVWDTFKFAPSLFYITDPTEMPLIAKAAHNIFFQVLGDTGFLGLMIFLAILFNAMWTCLYIRKLAVSMGREFIWARDLADMIGVSLFAYVVGGGGVSLAYYEFPYALYLLLEMVKQHLIRVGGNSSLKSAGHTGKALRSVSV